MLESAIAADPALKGAQHCTPVLTAPLGLVWLVVLVANCAGNQDSSISALAGDTTIPVVRAYDDLKIVKTQALPSTTVVVDNAVTYVLPPDHTWSGVRTVQYLQPFGNKQNRCLRQRFLVPRLPWFEFW